MITLVSSPKQHLPKNKQHSVLRKHALVNIKYIGRKEQEVYFISSHVGILPNN